MAKQNILLVDDDPRHLRVMEVSLRNAGYVVTTATDGATALTKAATVTPSLIISDTEMPTLDGFGLCDKLKADPGLRRVPFLFLSEDDSVESKVRGLELGADDYLTRPIYTRELVARVKMVLQKQARERAEKAAPGRRRFYGALADMGVVDLLQTMARGEKSGTIRIDRPPHHATLWFRDGQVVDASTGTLQGEEAVFRLMTWETGDFEIDFRAPQRPPAMQKGTADLLMEGLRRVDAWNRITEQLPSLEAIYEVDYDELAERLAELPDEANTLLRLFDGRRSALEVIDDADMPDLDALELMSQLYFEGVVLLAEDARKRRSTAPAPLPAASAAAAPRLADELIRSVTGGYPAVADSAPASRPDRRARAVAAPAASAALPAPAEAAEEPSAWGALDQVQAPTRVVQPPPEPVPTEAPEDDFPALPESTTLAEAEGEGDFFSAPGPSAPVDDDDLLFDDPPPSEGLPLGAKITLGLAAVAIIGLGAFFLAQDRVEPRPLDDKPLRMGWHKDEVKRQEPVGKVKPLEAEWRIPNEPGGGETPPIPRIEALAAAVAPVEAAPEPAEGAPVEAAPAEATPEPTPRKATADRAAAPKPPSKTDKPEATAEPEVPGNDVRGLIAEGQTLHRARKYKDAITRYEKALALAPNNKGGLVSYAKALLEVNRLSDALEAAERASRLDKTDAEVFLLLGNARQDLGQEKGSIEAYERYLALAPNGKYADEVRQVIKGMKVNSGQ